MLHTFDGPRPGSELGKAVAGAGDVDADTYDDLIIAAPEDNLGTPGLFSGSFAVHSGLDGSVIHDEHGHLDDNLGMAVDGAGDVDGDGYDDYMVVRRHDLTETAHPGTVLVYSGRTGTLQFLLFGDEDEDRFGTSIAGLGDLDGDGLDDFFVGAPQIRHAERGYARVYSGCTASLGTPLCFGSGCPCGNDDPAPVDAGCANSTGSGGLLLADGASSVAMDNLTLVATGLPPDNQGIYYMGDTLVSNPFFDGLQCALGTTLRFFHCIQSSGPGGEMTCTDFAADSAGLITPGSIWYFQAWYRDVVVSSPCGSGANLTNAVEVCFSP